MSWLVSVEKFGTYGPLFWWTAAEPSEWARRCRWNAQTVASWYRAVVMPTVIGEGLKPLTIR